MPTIITIKGIEESIFNLQYRNKSALKYQLVHTIRDFYQDEKSTETLQAIDGDKLIQRLWQINDDPIAIKNKRKNLNSIKSTVNTDLRKLYQEGLNPEGIIIGPDNVFIMSEEAKEAVFENFRSTMGKTGLVDLGKMLEVLNIINESLFDVEGIIEKEGTNAAEKMNKLKSLIQGLAGKVNLERSFLERSPEKLQIPTDQEERARSKESQFESVSPEPWKPAEGKAPLRELSDYPEHEEPEMTGEVFEEDLDQDEMAQLRLDAELETAELSGDELDRLDEMALEDQPVDSENEIIEDDLELIEEPLRKDDGEVEIAAEQIPVEDQEAETEEFAIDAELETEELPVEDAEIADDTYFIAEEMAEEPVTLADEEDLIAEIEEETLIETFETSATETLAEPGPATVTEDFKPEDAEIDRELNAEVQGAQIGETELETGIVEGALSTEAAEVFADQEKEDITETAVEEAPEESPAEILESEKIDATALSEDEDLAEDMEPEDEKPAEEDQADSEDLEAVEVLPEPEGILEEAAEDIEELDLDEAFEKPVVTVIPEADQEEEVQGPEIELSPLMEGAGPADDTLSAGEEQDLALDEEESAEALIEEEETAVAEEPETGIEAETDQMFEITEDREEIDEEEIDEEEIDEEEIVPEAEEIAEDELEEVEGLDVEMSSAELNADEILEEIEDEPMTETAIEAEEDEFIEMEAAGDELSANAGESETAPSILPEGLFGFAEADIKANTERARYLAEDFNDSLAAMDKFHNQYILIPQGHYVIGGRQAQGETQAERAKEFPAFYMGKFPVTNALFEIFIEKTGYKTTAEKRGFGLVYYPRCRQTKNERSGLNMVTYRSALVSEVVKDACWYQPSGPGSTLHHKRNHPVVQVGLEDALAFAAWTGKRLPREEEWEAAGRGVKGLIYPWGARWKKGACNMEESDLGDTAPVEFYAEFGNEFGLVDMLGNVLEWTLDPVEENGRQYYVVKGGSWISKPGVRLTERLKLEKETCSNILGFRCLAY